MSRSMSSMAAALAAALLTACSGGDDSPEPSSTPQHEFLADVRVTRYGVPHVQAADFASLGFGVAQVYLRDNFCTLADQVLTVNGERAKYLGTTGPAGSATVSFVSVPNRDSDFFHKSYFDDQALKTAYQQASIESQELVRGYIAGYNEFVQAAPAADAPARNTCDGANWVRSIEERDFLRLLAAKSVLASGAAFARAIATAQPPGTVAGSPKGKRNAQAKLDRDVVMAQLNPYPTRGAASNAYAIGKDATAGGTGMLLGNPHYPWPASTNRFYEVHLTVPGKLDVFGGMNGDTPVPLIGFNKDVAWTHTVSPALRQTLFELSLVPGSPTRYRVGNEERDMVARDFSIEVRQPDGSLITERRTLYKSHLGAVLQINSLVPGGVNLQWTATTAYALRDANLNSVRQVDQWLRIGQADSVRAIQEALGQVAAVPFVHTIAADRHGEALMADIGPVPNVTAARLQPATTDGSGGCVKGKTAQAILQLVNLPILDGSRPDCDWAVEAGAPAPGLMPVAKLPAIVRSDYVANSNQSAWIAHPQSRIDELEPILGGAGTPLSLRQRLAFTQIEQRMAGIDGLSPAPGFDSLETMRKMLYGNRLLAAELVLPAKGLEPSVGNGLLEACLPQTPGEGSRLVALTSGPFAGQTIDIGPACAVLQAWDGRANLDSRGTVLFREFWRRLRMPAGTPLWTIAFDPLDPVHTPRALNNTAGPAIDTLRHALAETVADLAAKELDITKPLSELQSVTRAGKRIALPGDDEHVGPFNKVTPIQPALAPLTKAGYTDVINGSSYIQAVTWVNGVVEARGLLAYSQSSNPASMHFADQTDLLYAASKFAKLPFSEADIAAEQIGAAERIFSRRLR